MNMIFITVGVFMTAFAGMAIGVIISNRRIKGSCGGIAAILGTSGCDSCAFKEKCKDSGKELCEEADCDEDEKADCDASETC